MNDDASTFELPEYIHSRLQPQIFIDFPEKDEELEILKMNLPFADEMVLHYVVDFLQAAHRADERYSPRDGINLARYALKRLSARGLEGPSPNHEAFFNSMQEAASMVLDAAAARYFKDLFHARRDEPTD
jgi:hypothetical protein